MKKLQKIFTISSLALLVILAIWLPSASYAQTCSSNASKKCISNIVYWYDSCGALQSVYQNCNNTNQICQNGQCVNKTSSTPSNPPTTNPPTGIIKHDVKSCHDGDLYWYSSNGALSDVYQSCKDDNSCTLDNCAGNQCVNQLKCDGSTCATSSADYAKYCANNSNTNTNQPSATIQVQASAPAISVALLASAKNTTLPLEKNIEAGNNNTIGFLEVIKNTSDVAIDNVIITTDLTSNLTYTGNLKIDDLASVGNIGTGINLGTLSPKATKILSFSATVNNEAPEGVVQITSNINASNIQYDSDSVALTIGTNSQINSTSNTSFWDNIKTNWYIWLAIVIVLGTVFVILFRKLSSSN